MKPRAYLKKALELEQRAEHNPLTRNGKSLFHGSKVKAQTVSVRALPQKALAIGEIVGIIYATTRDGELKTLRHMFKKHSRPLLAVSQDGNQLVMIGGSYQFTERGIVDR